MTFALRTHSTSPLALALFVLGGCGAQAGGQTGEETDDGCVFELSELLPEEPSELGFSAAEVLEIAEGDHEAPFAWLSGDVIEYGPESGDGEVRTEIAASAPARFARVDPARSAFHCQDHVRIPVSVALSTAGGAFDESFASNLVATGADEAALTALVPATSLKGAFAFEADALGERSFIRLEINLRFTTIASAGYLLAGIESGAPASGGDGTSAFQALPLACWGQVPSLAYACGD